MALTKTVPGDSNVAERDREALPDRAGLISCLAAGQEEADRVIRALITVGIPTSAISVVTRATLEEHPRRGGHPVVDAVSGAGAGALAGSGLAWLIALGIVVMPLSGILVAAGPLLAACVGAATGTVVGGLAGGLIGLGMHASEVSYIEEQVSRGRILISVHTRDESRLATAKTVLHALGEANIAG